MVERNFEQGQRVRHLLSSFTGDVLHSFALNENTKSEKNIRVIAVNVVVVVVGPL